MKNAELHFLLKKNFASVLENNPYIDKKFYFDDDLSRTIDELKKENYDCVIDLQKNFRSARIKSALGVKNYTFDKLNFKKWILVNFKINLLPDVHIVDRYMLAAGPLGVKNDGAGLDYFLSADDEGVIDELPESHRTNYVALVIGAKHFTKKLPVEKLISVAGKINSSIILLGGPEDFEAGEKISSADPLKIFNACGKFPLNKSAAIIKNARKVITHDTGLMHIAAAFKKNIISVWGNTVPAFGMYPYFGNQKGNSLILEVNGLSCRPCSKIGFERCPRGHFRCMKDIDENSISKFVN